MLVSLSWDAVGSATLSRARLRGDSSGYLLAFPVVVSIIENVSPTFFPTLLISGRTIICLCIYFGCGENGTLTKANLWQRYLGHTEWITIIETTRNAP